MHNEWTLKETNVVVFFHLDNKKIHKEMIELYWSYQQNISNDCPIQVQRNLTDKD